MDQASKTDHDVIIVGGGAAGLTAALFAARRGLRTLVITQDIGGQASTTTVIENYPGIERIDGPVLMQQFRRQAEAVGASIFFDEIIGIGSQGTAPTATFTVAGRKQSWTCLSVILTQGLTRQYLNVPGEKEMYAKGVSYSAAEDAPTYKDKVVAVIGGGNAAAQAVLAASPWCKTVYLIHRRAIFDPEVALLERLKKCSNVIAVPESHITKINGIEIVTGVIVEHLQTHEQQTIPVAAVFVETGFAVKKELVRDLAETTDRGTIVINDHNQTSVPGLFAAGDVSSVPFRQIVISAGEGAKAALTAQKYLQTRGLIKAVAADWGQAPVPNPKIQ